MPPCLPAKRGETRPCPVCAEPIPLRLIPAHAELEMERVEEILSNVGSTEAISEPAEAYAIVISYVFMKL
jgi:hypothetical protein